MHFCWRVCVDRFNAGFFPVVLGNVQVTCPTQRLMLTMIIAPLTSRGWWDDIEQSVVYNDVTQFAPLCDSMIDAMTHTPDACSCQPVHRSGGSKIRGLALGYTWYFLCGQLYGVQSPDRAENISRTPELTLDRWRRLLARSIQAKAKCRSVGVELQLFYLVRFCGADSASLDLR